MRRSGTNHISAITTYSVVATHGRTKASGTAAAYNSSDYVPFRSTPTARASAEVEPLQATIVHSKRM